MRNEVIVRKMAGYVSKVLGYCEGCNYDSFVADSKLVEACVFNLSQLGELLIDLAPSGDDNGMRCTACVTA